MNKYKNEIIKHCNTAQALITELYKSNPKNETFEQAGIINGAEIVVGYIDHGELGVALEHLLYMIHESDISYSPEALKRLHLIAEEYEIKISYTNNA